MKTLRISVAVLLTMAVLFQLSPHAKACGPESLQPIFVMQDSPDPPFGEFTQGKIGIVKPSFGRKTLVIAYRYLNGGAFNEEEQKALIQALKGTGPEPDTEEKVKEWIAARKLVVKDEDELPDIYRESRFGSYDFFPNCTSNAFEVAIETLRDRASTFGADSNDVHEWLSGQDVVFRNCSDKFSVPTTLGVERPEWLQKDRDYQIAASFFYSLQFDEAVKRFEQISHDNQSSWQLLADYLVGRTLVRQASLERDEPSKQKANQKAEAYLIGLRWCVLPQTVYDDEQSKEIPKQVFRPRFLTPELLNAAEKERAELIAFGDAKSLLGKKAIEWAKVNPNDIRVPEALFIAAKANESYKYGCNSWEHDEKIREEAASLLIEKYPDSVWALKMRETER